MEGEPSKKPRRDPEVQADGTWPAPLNSMLAGRARGSIVVPSDEVEALLARYLEASQRARVVLGQQRGYEVSASDLQGGLIEVLNLSESPPLVVLDQRLTADAMVELLATFDFRKFHPVVLAEFVAQESLVPPGIKVLLTEQTVKAGGEVWRVHRNDADPFPSNPHAHNAESGIKMHLGTGELFRRNKSVGKLDCKELLRIRSELKDFTLPATNCH